MLGDAAQSVDRVEILEGNRQTGEPGEVMSPFVVKVLNANGEPVNAVDVNWTVNPVNGGRLSSDSNTKTDINGESRNTFTVDIAERVVITATILNGAISTGRRVGGRAEGDPSVEFIVNGGIADTAGLNANQRSVGVAVENACSAIEGKPAADRSVGENDLLATCNELRAGDPDSIAQGLSLLAPDEITSQGTAVIEAANLQVMNVNSRLSALRSGAQGLDLSGLSLRIDGQSLPGSVMNALAKGKAIGGSAGDTQDLSGLWGVFINGNYSFGDKDDTDNETGFEFDSQGITLGADYRLSNQMILGGAVGVTNNQSDFNNSSGNMEMDGVHLMAYGTYYQSESFYLDGLIKLGSNDYVTDRRVSREGDLLQEAAGDTEGMEYSLSLSGGYDYNQGALSYGPYGRLSFTRAEIDAYTESATRSGVKGEGSVLTLSDQEIDSTTAVLGGQVSYAISRPNGVLLPQARFEWEHEFSDGSRELAAQFVHDPSNSTFSIITDEPDRDYLNVGLGLSMVAAEGLSGFLYYETRLDQKSIQQNWIKAGVRFEFW
ncbi:MAG: autotransporter outer membrane beta-barrel domain-containing protein [Thiothrix sp.]|nr:MAG: autotransporter outer membrane beta-barrel domain-containing protein [Thiothrix sp.]